MRNKINNSLKNFKNCKSKRVIFLNYIFLLSIFCSSCGIPSFFYLSSSFYDVRFTSNGLTDNTCNVAMSFDDQTQLQKCFSCPSVVLFYWIDRQDTIDQASSGISNNFNSKFKKSQYDGVALRVFPDDEYEPVVPTYTHIISSTTDTEEKKIEYNLYYPRLYDTISTQEKKISSPKFYYDLPSGETSLEFDIVQEDDPTSINYKKLYFIKNKGTSSEEKFELVRYNSKSFNDIPTLSEITSQTYSDYISVDSTYTEGSPLYAHFCVAFCASAGNFNNIFWSNLFIRQNMTFKIS